METPMWLKKIIFWGIHFSIWVIINVLIGSLPLLKPLLINNEDDPFRIGVLCFCFTIISSAIYATLVNFIKNKSNFSEASGMLMLSIGLFSTLALSFAIAFLSSITSHFDESLIERSLYALYFLSITLFFLSNRRALSDLVNHHITKGMIMNPVDESKAEGSTWGNSLDKEETF